MPNENELAENRSIFSVDLKSELFETPTILLLIPGVEYNDLTRDIAKQLSGEKVIYVTLNKTYFSLKEIFEKDTVDIKNFVFIDGITKTIQTVPNFIKQAYFANSPGGLVKISIDLSKLLKQGFDYIVFDSLTNLLIYREKAPVAKFVSNTIARIRQHKSKAVFYALSVKDQKDLIQEAAMFVDRVIDLGK